MITRNHAALAGAGIGLIVPSVVLTLLWTGLGFGIMVGSVNLGHVLLPSSRMLLVGWRTTRRL
jgi:hypothetical protein